MTMRKFVGEYAKATTGNDPTGEDVIYGCTGPHASLESATADAIAKGKAANVMEWVAVKEYEWRGDKRAGEWECVQRWYGDYEAMVLDF